MQQLNIQYFWPLTEQIPLDLNFRECNQYQISCASTISPGMSGTTISSFATGTSWTTTSLKLQENETTMIVMKKPNLLRKLVFKLLGFKWEIK